MIRVATYVLALLLGAHLANRWVPDLPAVLRTEGAGRPVFFVPHSDETSALETARRYLATHGTGTIVSVDCRGQRQCGHVDPNRYFGYCTNRYDAHAMDAFRAKVFAHVDGPVVALHNNRGCRGTICLKRPYEGARVIAADDEGPNDVVIFNGTEVEPTGAKARFSACLANARIAQFYERAGTVADCSMSEAATRLGLFYFNLDTEIARGTDNQVALLERALACARRALDSRRVD